MGGCDGCACVPFMQRRREKGEKGEKGRATRGSESESVKNEPVVETGLSISVYQTRGLHADDLLAGFGGAAGLRVKPGAEYAEAGVGNDESSRHGGLLYEVEELTRVDCADLTDVREMLALARTRRDGHAHRAEATATIAELWVTTSETRVNPGLNPGMNPGMTLGMNPGMRPVICPGMVPGMNSDMKPGMIPGMDWGMRLGMNLCMNPGMNWA